MHPFIGSWQDERSAGAIGGATVPFRALDAERVVTIGTLAIISAAYFYAAIWRSAADHFWMDEVLAVFAARQPTLSGVWQVIWSGTDFSPPTYHFLLHGFIKAFGDEHSRLLWRIPSVLSVYGAAFCIFLLLSRSRLSHPASVLGFGVVLAFGLFAYAIQVRQYGLLALGLAIALLCWASLDEARSAKARLVCLWSALSICLCLHFYGIVEVTTIATAELAYTISRRRVRIAVWTALLLTVPVEAVLYPLASHLAAFNQGDSLASGYYAQPTLAKFLAALVEIVEGGLSGVPLVLAAALAIGVTWLRGRLAPRTRRSDRSEPAINSSDLRFVMIALAVLPFAAFAFSLFVTKSFSARYMAGAALLPAIVVPCLIDRLTWRRLASLAFVPLIVGVLLLRIWAPQPIADALAALDRAAQPLPIVIGEGLLYIELMEAAEPSTRSRLFYLTVPEGWLSPDPTNENEVVRLARLRPDYQVENQNIFLGTHKTFYVLARPQMSPDTTTPLLAERGLLGPPLDAGYGIQLFRSPAATNVQRNEIIP